MQPRIYHGSLQPAQIAHSLVSEFSRGSLRVQQFGQGDQIVVQIATRPGQPAGGQTALSVHLRKVEDGVQVQIGRQDWLGVAASLGQTALGMWRSPWFLLNRLDDLAQDIENLQLSEQVWRVIEGTARGLGASFELSERLRRMECNYCGTANPVGESNCIACGAPLGRAQPATCPNCGFVVRGGESRCPNCGRIL